MNPVCSCVGCSNVAVIQWTRFLTASELLAAQVQNPNSNITAENSSTAIFGCLAHQLTTSLVGLVHQNTCTAPNATEVPNCDCTPAVPAQPIGSQF